MSHAKKFDQPQPSCHRKGFAGRELLLGELRETPVEGFEIRKTLGKGGMGTVYLARDESGRDVALKLFQKVDENHDRFYLTKWFLRECTGLMILSHPNIVSGYGTGSSDDYLYLSMEKAEGKQLKTVIDRFGALDWESSRSIMQGIFAGIEEIHRTGVIHRDLKPENVMVKSTKSGPRDPKIIDFGVCYIDGFQEFWPSLNPAVQVPARYTAAGAEFATPEFRAPEFNEDEANRSPSVDIYSAGLIFYNMVSGRLPFDTPDIDADSRSAFFTEIHKHAEFECPSAVSRVVEIPFEAEVALMAALDKNPLNRPSAAELKKIVESC